MSKLPTIRDSMARNKFILSRGQQYISLLFWAVTVCNVVLINLKDYFELSFSGYIVSMVLGAGIVILGVWSIGYLDVRFKFYSAESKYSQTRQPVLKQVLDNTKKIMKKLGIDEG